MDYYIGQAGIPPDTFWKNTWKENQLMGEAYMVRTNIQWEQFRYLSAMVYNVNCTKRSQMIAPHKLFPLPQDVYMGIGKPKSTKEQAEAFINKIKHQKKEK